MISLRHVIPLLALACCTTLPAQQKQTDQRLYVVTYVDVYPNFADDVAKLMHQFTADSLKDPGSVRFEVVVDVARSNHFTMLEVWQSRQAFEAHTAAAHTRQFREKIAPMLGAPFDERLNGPVQ